jgi:F0F1-type ATP synthase membrane subunit b/b'
MAKTQELMDPKVFEVESVIQECRERIQQALELESSQLKEKAERDSSEIIATAKEEADKTIDEARQEAQIESARIIASAKQDAEKMAEESREESARVINEARKKVLETITEVMQSATAQAQSEITRASSEARTKTSELLAQAGRSFEEMISETETRLNAEFEHLATVIADTATKLPEPGEKATREVQNKESGATSRPEVEEEIEPPTSVSERTGLSMHKVADVSYASNRDSGDNKLFDGSLTLEVVSPFGQEHQGVILERLMQINGLKVRSTEGFTKANRWITKYNIYLKLPTPLLKILRPLPGIKDISDHKDNIVVTLK